LTTTIQVLAECGKSVEAIAEILGVDRAAIEIALQEDRYAIAARYLHKTRKMSLPEVGQALNMSEARVHGAARREGGHTVLAGRLLGNALQTRLDVLCDEDSDMCCPVTLMLFREPVIASDGFMYEADSVKQLIRGKQASPITREPLQKDFFQAKQKKSEVMAFREKRAQELLQFAEEALNSEPRMTATALDRILEYLVVLKPSSCPSVARPAADLWQKTGKPVPNELRPHLGMSTSA
jgi:biotin operon repressor